MDRSFLHSVSVRSTLLVLTNKFSNKSIFPAIFRDFWDFPDNISYLIRQFFLEFFWYFLGFSGQSTFPNSIIFAWIFWDFC